MQGLPALIERLVLDRDLRGRSDLLTETAPAAPDATTLAAQLAVGIDIAQPGGDESLPSATRLPAGVRLGRLAYSPVRRAGITHGEIPTPAGLFHLPEAKGALIAFLAERTGLGSGAEVAPEVEEALQRFHGLSFHDVAADCLFIRDQDAVTYALLLSREFDLAVARMPTLIEPHPRYPRLARGLLDALLILAELERLRDIAASLAGALPGGAPAADRKAPSNRDCVRLLLGEEPSAAMDDATIAAFLADTPFHVETLLWQVAAGPVSINPEDELLAILSGRSTGPEALRFPEGRKRLAGMLKEARAMRTNRAGKTIPIGLARYMGLDLLDTATVGLVEIASGTARLGNTHVGDAKPISRITAFWTLLIALLSNVAPRFADEAKDRSLRGPARSRGHAVWDIDKGEARLRRASGSRGLMHAYLPPADTPLGWARFVPGHWLHRDRHHAWSRRIVQDFRGGAYRGMFDALPAAWKPALLVRISALQRTLREIEGKISASGERDDDLAAATLNALLSAATPLSSDPLLHHVLERHRKTSAGR